jgi:hypothetical protein
MSTKKKTSKNFSKYCLVVIAVLMTACNGEDSNFWKLKTGSIESGNRFEVINKTSKRELKIKLCGVVPQTQVKAAHHRNSKQRGPPKSLKLSEHLWR